MAVQGHPPDARVRDEFRRRKWRLNKSSLAFVCLNCEREFERVRNVWWSPRSNYYEHQIHKLPSSPPASTIINFNNDLFAFAFLLMFAQISFAGICWTTSTSDALDPTTPSSAPTMAASSWTPPASWPTFTRCGTTRNTNCVRNFRFRQGTLRCHLLIYARQPRTFRPFILICPLCHSFIYSIRFMSSGPA